ncbi:MAG: hypothetical protein ABEH65_05220 [Halobacteriales archaeon]
MTTNALIERKEERDDEPVPDAVDEDEDSTADDEKTLDEIIDTYAN